MTKTPLATALTAATVRARVSVTLTRANNAQAELVTFEGLPDPGEHIAVLVPPQEIPHAETPLVRVHSECMTGDIFGSARCDCGPQLDEALTRLAVEGGVLLYLRQEGRGIGLYNKLDTYVLQDRGKDTFEANRLIGRGEDERNYAVAAAMLHVLGLNRIRLLTNNPEKARQLQEHGITLSSIVATEVHLTAENARYLEAKAKLGGHNLTGADWRPA
ncbi:GTP cyclohydrolase II RibA [Streptomyces pseudovenezuelae]|uniref:GTP cyclohydrolase II n=1 Tax=Streptomyces pseudovenezuelae TaxID=67350 RepID=A0ABT6LZ69_9ACTN|nr:GTP cyclohydrolase II RibA [Streptomyces pseudovenezuelae]MDH6221592.1 GTP cyclohydrolase II [Streptomyces pseudovenezuelae]